MPQAFPSPALFPALLVFFWLLCILSHGPKSHKAEEPEARQGRSPWRWTATTSNPITRSAVSRPLRVQPAPFLAFLCSLTAAPIELTCWPFQQTAALGRAVTVVHALVSEAFSRLLNETETQVPQSSCSGLQVAQRHFLGVAKAIERGGALLFHYILFHTIHKHAVPERSVVDS